MTFWIIYGAIWLLSIVPFARKNYVHGGNIVGKPYRCIHTAFWLAGLWPTTWIVYAIDTYQRSELRQRRKNRSPRKPGRLARWMVGA